MGAGSGDRVPDLVEAGAVLLDAGGPDPDRGGLHAVFSSAVDTARGVLSLLEPSPPAGPAALCTAEDGDPSAPRPGAAPAAARARALLALTGHDEILVTASTAVVLGNLLGPGAELVDRGARPLAGHPPERVYELVPCRPGARTVASNLDWARRAAPGPMVGRDGERSAARAAWRSALRGERRTVLVDGEAGIGKTTFAATLALEAHAHGAQVLYGRWDQGQIAPFTAVREALGTYADRCPVDRLRAELTDHVGTIVRLLPDVAARLGVTGDRRGADPEWERLILFDAVGRWLARIASHRATLVVLDDLHWADPPSLLLLDHLHHNLPAGKPLMIVATERDGESGMTARSLLGAVRDDDATVRIALGGLDGPAVRQLVENALAATPAGSAVVGIAEELTRGTAGNPLLVQQLLLGLRAGTDDPAAAVLDRGARASGVRDVVGWRLGQLPAPTVDLLAAASVIGKHFDLDLLAAAVEAPPVTCEAPLEPARRAGLLDVDRPGTYRFVHDVVQEALGAQVAPDIAGGLHRRIGAALASRADAGEPVRPDEVAHHCLLGVDARTLGPAVTWARRAAALAGRETAFETAVDLLERAVGAHDRHAPDRPEDAELACRLRDELADAHDRAGQLEARDARHHEAAGIARRLGRTDLLVPAALGLGGRAPAVSPPDPEAAALLDEALAAVAGHDQRAEAMLLARRAQVLFTPSTHHERRAGLDRALAIARDHDDPDLLTRILTTRAITLDGPDDVAERLAIGDEIHRIGSRTGDRELVLLAARVRVPALLTLGRGASARRLTASYTEMAREMRHPGYIVIAQSLEVMWAMTDGDYERGEAAAGRLSASLLETGHPDRALFHEGHLFGLRWLRGGLAPLPPEIGGIELADGLAPVWWAGAAAHDAANGRWDEALARLARQDPAAFVEGVDKDFYWWPTISAGAIVAAAGDPAWASVLYDAIRPYAGQCCVCSYSLFVGAVDHHLGTLALACGRTDVAVAHLERGLDVHEGLGAAPFVALSALWLGHALARRGGPGDGDRAAALTRRSAQLAARHGLHGLANVGPGAAAPPAGVRRARPYTRRDDDALDAALREG
jgi:hypothetical protein